MIGEQVTKNDIPAYVKVSQQALSRCRKSRLQRLVAAPQAVLLEAFGVITITL
ncbi:hypothetical protein M3J09_011886 [Ascochyta lentis]